MRQISLKYVSTHQIVPASRASESTIFICRSLLKNNIVSRKKYLTWCSSGLLRNHHPESKACSVHTWARIWETTLVRCKSVTQIVVCIWCWTIIFQIERFAEFTISAKISIWRWASISSTLVGIEREIQLRAFRPPPLWCCDSHVTAGHLCVRLYEKGFMSKQASQINGCRERRCH